MMLNMKNIMKKTTNKRYNLLMEKDINFASPYLIGDIFHTLRRYLGVKAGFQKYLQISIKLGLKTLIRRYSELL